VFRYPGPKPQSIEAAVLMIVDTVEAASRSIDNPTRDKIAVLVDRILTMKIADGQFEECDLSTRDLATIRRTLIESLEASFHSRVKYPWQDEEEKKSSGQDHQHPRGQKDPEDQFLEASRIDPMVDELSGHDPQAQKG
jgi:hypothetical protein